MQINESFPIWNLKCHIKVGTSINFYHFHYEILMLKIDHYTQYLVVCRTFAHGNLIKILSINFKYLI